MADFFTALTKLAQTNLRNLIGDLELDKALTSRDTINTQLREVLDDATDKWGVRVVRVEIQRIDPPPEVVSAMHAQMRAERDRRATVTEAQGYREAAIARADGEKQSSILAAEGRKEAAILDAQGDAQAIELRADAVLAITDDAFIVYTSNVFAILGLRSLYFALASLEARTPSTALAISTTSAPISSARWAAVVSVEK